MKMNVKSSISLFAILIVSDLVFSSFTPHPHEDQADALITWKTSLSHFNITGALATWNTNTTSSHTTPYSPCKWQGIVCSHNGRVEMIQLGNEGLVGDLKNFNFSSFHDLSELQLSFNNLTGSIPPQIGKLKSLTYLGFSENKFHGLIPSTIRNLTNLLFLKLNGNQISGTIPNELFHLSQLQFLYLDHNQLVGSIAPSIGQIKSLRELDLSFNKLSGPIPTTLVNISILAVLAMQNNQINGSIPEEIGQMFQLRYLVLGSNQLVGSIPPSLGQLIFVSMLSLYDNKLTGPIPIELAHLTALDYLDLSSNQLTGDPRELICALPELIYFNISHNMIEENSSLIYKGNLPKPPRLFRNGECVAANISRYLHTFNNSNINKRNCKDIIIIVLFSGTFILLVLFGVLLKRNTMKEIKSKWEGQ
ncbi:hypothetical protein Scep_017422 [Stephania cephalantha]|uniref:Leucine-rich repeat-containing N-terminal plant-type domain-containing protein n=1 Tax=Stephania cephalantha TaxID=152367 RepID=A0AAP0IPJ7_9MAGN